MREPEIEVHTVDDVERVVTEEDVCNAAPRCKYRPMSYRSKTCQRDSPRERRMEQKALCDSSERMSLVKSYTNSRCLAGTAWKFLRVRRMPPPAPTFQLTRIPIQPHYHAPSVAILLPCQGSSASFGEHLRRSNRDVSHFSGYRVRQQGTVSRPRCPIHTSE